MTRDTAQCLIDAAVGGRLASDCLGFAFQGGEPTLAGIDFYRWFFQAVEKAAPGARVGYSFQTNGLLLDEDWCSLFQDYGVLVGISLDGGAQLHDRIRLDSAGKGTYQRVHAAMELLKHRGVPFNVLSVLTAETARHPTALWHWLRQEGVDYVQFIPCLDALDQTKRSPWALTPRRFYEFYRQLFPLWKQGLETGRLISVKLFDDLINQYLFRQATACGMMGQCTVQYVVESNGDIFPCDFYALDQYKMGSILEDDLSSLYAKGKRFLDDGQNYVQEEPCRSCPYLGCCGGGCKRQRDSMYLEKGVCYYARLLNEILPPLLATAKQYV